MKQILEENRTTLSLSEQPSKKQILENKTTVSLSEQPSKKQILEENRTALSLSEQSNKKQVLEAMTPNKLTEEKVNKTPQSEQQSNKSEQQSKENRTPLSEPPSKKRKKDHSDEKQRSILSFFAKFSPKVGSEKKSPKKLEDCPGSPNLRGIKSPAKTVAMKTPEKKIISSPIGYFKVDEEISIRTPGKNIQDQLSQEENKPETIVIDDQGYECESCKEVFGDETSLSRHKEIHKSKFQCQYCKITFTNLLSWKSHENSHKGVSFNCAVCEEKFQTEAKLDKHTKAKHMGRDKDEKITPLKMFFCEFCDYTSKYRGNIKKHTKAKHEEVTQSSDKAESESSEKSSVEGNEKSVIVIRSPSPINEIVDIDADEEATNSIIEKLRSEWDE